MPSPAQALPLHEIDTLFLDAGNTLVSIDFPRICRELSRHGVVCDVALLQRAEAAARPLVSKQFEALDTTEGLDAFGRYLFGVLSALPASLTQGIDVPDVCRALTPVLRVEGESYRLWCHLLDGVTDALEAFRSAGLRLVVVSNSDGTVEQAMVDCGLRPFFDLVVDSHLVGFEKPDPRIFEHALAESRSDPARTLHVGDMYFADVVGARRAGVHALLLDPYHDWPDADCPTAPDLTALERALTEARRR